MYVGPNLGSAHWLLFGAGMPNPVNDREPWGVDALDVFDRPITSATSPDGQLSELFRLGPQNSLLEPGGVPPNVDDNPSLFGGYFDWVERVSAFRDAATESIGSALTASGDHSAHDSGTSTVAEGEATTEPTQAERNQPADDATKASASAGEASTNKGGLLGGLLGGVFGG